MIRFSIVVPTFNRAHLLRHSLPTALEQTFDDYEVVVSDNVSTDGTREVVSSFSSGRLRVVRPERSLSIVDHWEYALGQSRGEWVLFLCDDDALLPQCLARLDAVIREAPGHEVIQYDRFCYVYGDGIRDDGNYVKLGSRVLGGLRTMDSAQRLSSVIRRLSIEMPKFLNSVVSRSLIERLRARRGRVFGAWAPDIWIGVTLLGSTRRYLKTGPLMLWGLTRASYGSGAERDPALLREFFGQFPQFDGTLPFSPYPQLLSVTNSIFDTMCRAKRELGAEGARLAVDPVRLRSRLLQDAELYLERGHEEFRELRDRIRRDLRRYRISHGFDPRVVWQRLSGRVRSLPQKLQGIAAGRKTAGLRRRYRFENIGDAARFVGKLEQPR